MSRARCRLPVPAGSLVSGQRLLDGESFHYIVHVRRLSTGDSLELFDGAGFSALATVVGVDASRARLDVGDVVAASVESPISLTVLLALIKGERMELAVQKLVELGVTQIVPVRAARSVVKLDARRAGSRQRRLQSIAAGAARQSGRTVVPQIREIHDFAVAVQAEASGCRIMLAVRESGHGIGAALDDVGGSAPSSISLLVGPEGGFESTEVALARAAGWSIASLGPRVLRAETAAIAAATAVQLLVGDLNCP